MSQRDPQGKKDKGRFSSRRRTEAVLRLLRGEDLDTLSRELGVTAACLSRWREGFLAGGEAGLKSRPGDGREQQVRELQARVGELTMDHEASREAVSRHKESATWTRGGRAREPGALDLYWRALRCGLAPPGVEHPPLDGLPARRHSGAPSAQPPAGRGPDTVQGDAALTAVIKATIQQSPFTGEGHRNVWARLRQQGIRTGKPRVPRLMRDAGLLAPQRRGPWVHHLWSCPQDKMSQIC
ncbi:IS3 family transposase [Spiribacter halobius]|nr:IS3 family transposase [Spiribacter halobius]UEX77261.1 IS3 family transposase [Spiribacter halobius]